MERPEDLKNGSEEVVVGGIVHEGHKVSRGFSEEGGDRVGFHFGLWCGWADGREVRYTAWVV